MMTGLNLALSWNVPWALLNFRGPFFFSQNLVHKLHDHLTVYLQQTSSREDSFGIQLVVRIYADSTNHELLPWESVYHKTGVKV